MAAKTYEDQSGKKFKTHAEAKASNIKTLAASKEPTVYLASVPSDGSRGTVETNRRFASGRPLNEQMNSAVDAARQALTPESLSGSSAMNVATPSYANYTGAGAGAFSTTKAGFAIPEFGSVNADGSVNKYNTQTGELLKDPAQYDPTGVAALRKEREQVQPPDTAKIYQDLEQQTRVREFQQQVNDYSGQLNAIKAKAEADQLSLEGQGRGIPEAIIGGQQAKIAREAAIKSLPVAAQLANAQGNLGLAQQHLDTMFKIQVEDAKNKYNHKMKLIESAMDIATEEEKRRLQIYDKKVANQHDFDLLNARENSKQILGSADTGYFEYDPATRTRTPITGGDSPNTPNGYRFTSTQLNKGANAVGVDLATFKSLAPEVQNFYISSPTKTIQAISSALGSIASGKEDASEVIADIEADTGLNDEVKQYLIQRAESISAPAKEPGFFAKSWDGLKSFLGI